MSTAEGPSPAGESMPRQGPRQGPRPGVLLLWSGGAGASARAGELDRILRHAGGSLSGFDVEEDGLDAEAAIRALAGSVFPILCNGRHPAAIAAVTGFLKGLGGACPTPGWIFEARGEPVAICGLGLRGSLDEALRRVAGLPESLAWPALLFASRRQLPEPVQDDRVARWMRSTAAVPGRSFWLNPDAYGRWLERSWAAMLAEAPDAPVPADVQYGVLSHLHVYFVVDERPRAPTMAVDDRLSAEFHAALSAIGRRIEPSVVEGFVDDEGASESALALAASLGHGVACRPLLDRCDWRNPAVRVRAVVPVGAPPPEPRVQGERVMALAAKRRHVVYLGRHVLDEHVLWLPMPTQAGLSLWMQGRPATIGLRRPRFKAPGGLARHDETLEQVGRQDLERNFGRGRWLADGRAGLSRALALGIRWLARQPWVRRRYADAWVFMDREQSADDNAEHLYRWVLHHAPGRNAWFLLSQSSPDWQRLRGEGFRLMPAGLRRRLLLLNCSQIVSSHTDIVEGGLSPPHFGDTMRWDFTFVPHGITKDDVSHWFNGERFDRIATTSPAERDSIAADGSPYRFTGREVAFTGWPRHDSLLSLARATPAHERRLLLLMPTWRASLFDDRAPADSERERLALVEESEFARTWRAVLNCPELREILRLCQWKLAFMAHTNLAPVLPAFAPAADVEVFVAGRDRFQPILARSVALVTDYTSVAFEMAFLRRGVFYLQGDRERFYRTDHNWRPGFFDYDRDGFGPVARTVPELIAHLRAFAAGGGEPDGEHLRRMQALMPHQEGSACERVYRWIAG